jgi:hypothetical protein
MKFKKQVESRVKETFEISIGPRTQLGKVVGRVEFLLSVESWERLRAVGRDIEMIPLTLEPLEMRIHKLEKQCKIKTENVALRGLVRSQARVLKVLWGKVSQLEVAIDEQDNKIEALESQQEGRFKAIEDTLVQNRLITRSTPIYVGASMNRNQLSVQLRPSINRASLFNRRPLLIGERRKGSQKHGIMKNSR